MILAQEVSNFRSLCVFYLSRWSVSYSWALEPPTPHDVIETDIPTSVVENIRCVRTTTFLTRVLSLRPKWDNSETRGSLLAALSLELINWFWCFLFQKVDFSKSYNLVSMKWRKIRSSWVFRGWNCFAFRHQPTKLKRKGVTTLLSSSGMRVETRNHQKPGSNSVSVIEFD